MPLMPRPERNYGRHETPDKKGHHTGHLAHPTIVGDRVYFNKHTFAFRTGEVLDVEDFNWHGCGVMSASNHVIFSRYEYHGMFDLDVKEAHRIARAAQRLLVEPDSQRRPAAGSGNQRRLFLRSRFADFDCVRAQSRLRLA